MKRHRLLLRCTLAGAFLANGTCRQAAPSPSIDNGTSGAAGAAQPATAESALGSGTTKSSPKSLELPVINPPAVPWVRVEKASEGAPGGYATGSFDQPRNKIIIETRDVQQFILDTGQIGLDWSRPVVLTIDKKSYELRRREDPAIRFDRNRYGEWVVIER